MDTATLHSTEARMRSAQQYTPLAQETRAAKFIPLEQVTNPTVTTNPAAYYLDRMPQTLRGWACHENGPLRPIRINGRLAWKTDDIRKLLGVK